MHQLVRRYGFENTANSRDEHVLFNGATGNLVVNQSGYLPTIKFFDDNGNNGVFGHYVEIEDLKHIQKIDGEPTVKWAT